MTPKETIEWIRTLEKDAKDPSLSGEQQKRARKLADEHLKRLDGMIDSFILAQTPLS